VIAGPGRRGLAALAVATATLALLLATEPRLAIVWDEGYTLGREARLRDWFRALADPARFAATWHPPSIGLVQQVGAPAPSPDAIDTRAKLLFDPRVLAWFWPFARAEPHGHPPFYALVGLIGDVLAPTWALLPRARLGPMLVFSLTAGALFLFVARRWGTWPGVLAAGSWVLQPRLFGHGHYATYDALLSSLWLGSVLAFAVAVERAPDEGEERSRRPRWSWVVAFGLLAGAAADTKFTGWLLPLPFLAWSVLYRDRRGIVTLFVGGIVALLALYALNPPWWIEPVAGVERFLRSNLTRGRTIPIPVLFLGRIYETPNQSLPWYNTLVWTLFVVPVGFLAMAVAGVVHALRKFRSEPIGLLAVGHWAFLMILRALPHTPGHDGVRQFLPAFGLLPLVAGLGAAAICERFPRIGRALIVTALIEGVVSVALMLPVPLSYYSPMVGGLPGAEWVGMEPTYYWDALGDDALDWLNAHPGGKVRFATYPTSWLYLARTGRLTARFLPTDPGGWSWYVLQNRPGAFTPLDRALVARGRPAHVVRKLGVPLIWIFPYAEVERLSGPAE
jgi:4-amino-4-deoxy-L-arabinose transferase-like glycosyltransferase